MSSSWQRSSLRHNRPLLTVVVPVRDEVANIGPLVAEIRTALDCRFSYELIVVDDCSQDGTWNVVSALAEANADRMSAIRLEQPCGQSMAVLTGARAGCGEWLVVLDGDGQDDPAEVPGMVRRVVEAAAVDGRVAGVIGHRTVRHDKWARRMASRLARAARNLVLQDGIPDIGCGLKVMRLDWYRCLPAFDHMHRFIPVLFQAQGGVILVHPVHHRPRRAGRSKYGLWNRFCAGVVDLAGVRWLKRRTPAVQVGAIAP